MRTGLKSVYLQSQFGLKSVFFQVREGLRSANHNRQNGSQQRHGTIKHEDIRIKHHTERYRHEGPKIFDNIITTDDFHLTLSAIDSRKPGDYSDTLIFPYGIQEYPHLPTMLKLLHAIPDGCTSHAGRISTDASPGKQPRTRVTTIAYCGFSSASVTGGC